MSSEKSNENAYICRYVSAKKLDGYFAKRQGFYIKSWKLRLNSYKERWKGVTMDI